MEDPQSKCRHVPAEATLQSTASTSMLGQSLLMPLEYLLGHVSALMPVEFQWTTWTCKSRCPAHPELSPRAQRLCTWLFMEAHHGEVESNVEERGKH